MPHLTRVKDISQVRTNIALFVKEMASNRDFAIELARQTTYWVYDPEGNSFGPSKFIGFQEMNFNLYQECRQITSTGDKFNGGISREAIEDALNTKFAANQDLSTKLIDWANRELSNDCFKGISVDKWEFITLSTQGYITDDIIQELLGLLRSRYPDWQNFSDPAFVKDEFEYKQMCSQKVQDLLSKDTMTQLLAEGKYDQIIKRLEKAGQSSNLLYLAAPKTSDLSVLYSDNLNQESFCKSLIQLLYGTDDIGLRLKVYTEFLETNGLPNKWVFPTFLLYMLYPDKYMFVKPTATTWFLGFLGLPVKMIGTPNPSDYSLLNSVVHELFTKLSNYSPKNLIDIQSLIWVSYRASRPETTNFWWVNQGRSYGEERAKGIIWSPYKNESGNQFYHWDNVSKVKQGDIVLHYSQGSLCSVSRAESEPEDAANPHEGTGSEWAKKGRQVHLKYYDLAPIVQLDQIQPVKEVSEVTKGPLDINKEVKQGYLFNFSPKAYQALQSALPNVNWPDFDEAPSNHKTWIFQANPNKFKVKEAIQKLEKLTWLINRNIAKASINDKVFLWESGSEGGIVASATLIELPSEREQLAAEKEFAVGSDTFAGSKMRVLLKVDRIFHSTILRTQLIRNPDISNFEIIKQPNGTNYLLNQNESRLLEKEIESIMKIQNTPNLPLNTIFYGPPGTGKTYMAYEQAVKIADPDYKMAGRIALMKRYNELREAGRIQFVTFHQSYSYEEFIEGIRPHLDGEGETKYRIHSGVLKEIARLASAEFTRADKSSDIDYDNISYYKMSLGQAAKAEDDSIYEYCIQNGYISLGWGEEVDFSVVIKEPDPAKRKRDIQSLYSEGKTDKARSMVLTFVNDIKKGDLVFVSNGNRSIRAIGIVSGDYSYMPNTEINYNHFRPVEWLIADVDIPAEKIYGRNLTQASVYQFAKDQVCIDNIKEILGSSEHKGEPQNYVLIIDEINRANISKVFGEVITLLDRDKRLNATNATTITLPYSQEQFGLPNNVYIVGTMNTADRSIALLDVALRRRFVFEELMPKSSVIQDVLTAENIPSGFVDLVVKVFEVLNRRIEFLLDCDHQIGHSYFLEVKDESSLMKMWNGKILPLVKEYFYNDWERLKLLLGDASDNGFVQDVSEIKVYQNLFKDGDALHFPSQLRFYSDVNEFVEALNKSFCKYA